MFYIGGSCRNSNIELHDVRFSLGADVDACIDDLHRQWWGEPKSLHLDCWGRIEQADGYDVAVKTTPQDSPLKLFFLNLGGYDPERFEELHRNVLLVAETPQAAIVRALKAVPEWSMRHRDNIYEVEHIISLSDYAHSREHYLHLTKAAQEKPFEFTCKYRRLDL